jgi:hypothetical protein
MSQINRLREQIDACRPGSHDLALPALAELAQAAEQDRAIAAELDRSQQFDRSVASAMHDVAVPPGLLDRLLTATEAAAPAAGVSLPAPVSVSQSSAPTSRRAWLVVGGSIALTALIALSASFWLRPAPVVSQADLSIAVTGWMNALNKPWTPITASSVPVAWDRAVVVGPRGWQSFSASDGAGRTTTVAAINLAPPLAPRAVLFVIPAKARYSVPAVPSANLRLSLSGGYTATAWQRKGSKFLYVLVVETGRGQQLRHYLQEPYAA